LARAGLATPKSRVFGESARHGARKRAAVAKLAAPYRPRKPEETVLHRVVRRHLETFIAHAAETYDSPLPRYVRDELRAYLKCGVFAHGFLRARCEACKHDLLIAFSCKGRSVCPSCAGRRMNNTAAHIVDRVIPAVPVRQWVLSLPYDLRALAACDAKLLKRIIQAFARAIEAHHRRFARAIGIVQSTFAAITFVQRFGSSLNLNVHLHVVVADGVFSRDDETLSFTPAHAPTRDELIRVARDVMRKLDVRDACEDTQPTLAACMRLATSRGDVRAMSIDGEAADDVVKPHSIGDAVDIDGFNLEASVHVDADDDFGREHLLRYCARPALSLARLSELSNGMIAYRIKKLRNHRSKVRYMTPLELLARIAALVPPPRYPLVRYHGAFAPRSSWRRLVVPKPPSTPKPEPKHAHAKHETPSPKRYSPKAANALVASAVLLTPNTLSIRHWERLHSGALLAASPRVDWPTLMRRTFDTDVLACPKCDGRLRVIAIVDDRTKARAILDELGFPQPRIRHEPATQRRCSPTTCSTLDRAKWRKGGRAPKMWSPLVRRSDFAGLDPRKRA
jgi:hypothetical protein